jgi:replicative DNA helicase
MTQASSELWNGEAETIVLASFIRNPKDYYSVNDIELEWKDFQFPVNRSLAKAIFEVVDEMGEPEIPFIIESLNLTGDENAKTLVSDLSSTPVTVEQAHEAARIVKSLSTARQLQKVGVDIIDIAKQKRTDYEGAVAEAESKIRRLADQLPEPERSPKPSEILARIKAAGPMNAIPIGFSPSLNWATGGLQPGHLWVVGGFSSVGKSAWACNMAIDAVNNGRKVSVISAEMPQETYLYRLLAILSNVDQNIIRDGGRVSFADQKALAEAEKFLSQDNMSIYDNIYSMSNIRSNAKRIKERDGLDVLVVDFIQNIQGSWGDEVKDAREVALECQRLAKDLQITVVALSQLSNSMAQQDEADGGESDYYAFKGSGAIKDAADVALMLRRGRRNQSPIMKVEVKKNRHGPLIKNIDMFMDMGSQRIREMERDEDYEA